MTEITINLTKEEDDESFLFIVLGDTNRRPKGSLGFYGFFTRHFFFQNPNKTEKIAIHSLENEKFTVSEKNQLFCNFYSKNVIFTKFLP